MYIFYKFPGDADTADPGATLAYHWLKLNELGSWSKEPLGWGASSTIPSLYDLGQFTLKASVSSSVNGLTTVTCLKG